MAYSYMTVYGRKGTSGPWSDWTDPSNINSDENRYYLGSSGGYNYRFCLKFTTPNSYPSGYSTKLVVKIRNDSKAYPQYMRGFLSTSNNSSSNSDYVFNNTYLKMSYLYSNENGTSRTPSPIGSGTDSYFVFTGSDIRPGTTYYLYVLPYSSDGRAERSPVFSGTWYRGQNKSGVTQAYVYYDIPSYTVSYNANGGYGAPGSQTKSWNSTLTLSSGRPSRSSSSSTSYFTITGNGNGGNNTSTTASTTYTTAYSFSHWNTQSNNGGSSYYPGGAYTSNSSATLYAIWSSSGSRSYSGNTLASLSKPSRGTSHDATYRVSFDTRSGSAVSPKSVDVMSSYSFAGWNSNSYGSGTTYSDSTSFTSDATVYAMWNRHTTYPSITLPSSSRSGYTFLGWSTNSSASSPSYYAGQSYTPKSSHTLYAVWKQNTYSIIYNANGGSGAPANGSYVVNSGNFTISNVKPTRPRYAFLGWSTSNSGSRVDYTSGQSVSSNRTGDIYLYAVWKLNEFTLSYNANGGSGAPESIKFISGDTSVYVSTKVPIRIGHAFKGWATWKNTSTVEYKSGDKFNTDHTNDVTLYAVWDADDYTIYYGAYTSYAESREDAIYIGGIEGIAGKSKDDTIIVIGLGEAKISSSDATIVVKDIGAEVPAPQPFEFSETEYTTLSSFIPVYPGYRFLGWSEEKYSSVPTYKAGGSFKRDRQEDVYLYAVWKWETFSVTFDANTGTNPPAPQNYEYIKGGTITLTSNIPAKKGYTFIGWSTTRDGDVKYQPGGQYPADTASSATLYAQWCINTYTITYSPNFHTYVKSKQYEVEFNSMYTVQRNIFGEIRRGYRFNGWNTKPDGSGEDYTSWMGIKKQYTDASDITLYAQWRIITNCYVKMGTVHSEQGKNPSIDHVTDSYPVNVIALCNTSSDNTKTVKLVLTINGTVHTRTITAPSNINTLTYNFAVGRAQITVADRTYVEYYEPIAEFSNNGAVSASCTCNSKPIDIILSGYGYDVEPGSEYHNGLMYIKNGGQYTVGKVYAKHNNVYSNTTNKDILKEE